MQTLYTLDSVEDFSKPGEPQKILQQHFNQTRSLLVYLTWFLTEVARYAETEAHKRAGKHLPTAEDLNVNTKIAGNEILWKMLEDAVLKEQFDKEKPQQKADHELIRRYTTIWWKQANTKIISLRHQETNRTKKKSLNLFSMICFLPMNYLFLISRKIFLTGTMTAKCWFSCWPDYIQKPGSLNFKQLLSPDKEEFAKNLLQTVLDKAEYLQSIITPKLKNWDPDRIAILDMLLMKMGLAEFLYFETIPPKVTINEYIDLAKDYSTVQSGQFVNGILDNIHKELVQQGKMQKVDYKKA